MNGALYPLLFLFFLGLCIPGTSTGAVSPWSDLMVSEISAPLVGYAGYPYEINVSVENHGNATSGLISVGFYLSTDNHLSTNDTFIQVTTGDPVSPGSYVKLYSIDTIPSTVTPGEYRLFAYVEDHEGDEHHLLDNTALLSAPVLIGKKTIPGNETISITAAEILFAETNEARTREGIDPLTWDEDLAVIAQAYTDLMVNKNFFSHIDPDGNDQSDRAKAAGYNTVKNIKGGQRIGVAENIAYMGTGNVVSYGYVNPTDPKSIAGAIMEGWLKSPGHRKNILDPLADRIGIGLTWNGEYWYAAQEFY